MSKRTETKAELTASNAVLREENSNMRAALHDMLVRGSPDPVVVLEPDPHDPTESLRVEARLFRPAGAAGGIVVITSQTIADSGSRSVTHMEIRPLDGLRVPERSYESAWGRALARLVPMLSEQRSRAIDEERIRRGLEPIGERA